MTTTLFPHSGNTEATVHFGTNNTRADGTAVPWDAVALDTTQGAALAQNVTSTVAGTTNGVESTNLAGTGWEWISDPLAADITISGTVTLNIWGRESSMTANAGPQVIIERVDSNLGLSTILNSEEGIEYGTAASVHSWTAAPTSTNMKRGDRIRLRILANDVGTMASGLTTTLDFNAATGVDGDTWIQFTENLTFESAPAGTTVYLTTTSAGINPGAANELEAWTSRGSGSTNSVTNTAAGWTAPISITDTAGGTVLEWYTKRLQAFTLGGKTKLNLRAKQSAASTNASLRADISICDGDGSNPVVWGTACLSPFDNAGSTAQLGTTDANEPCWIAGPDTSVADGKRLRIRVYVEDDCLNPLVTGRTVTVTYAGTTGGAAGDSFLTFAQTLMEFVLLSTTRPFDPIPFMPIGRAM